MKGLAIQRLLGMTALIGVLALSAATAAVGQENRRRAITGEGGGVESSTLAFCDGFGQEAVVTNTQNTATTTSSSSFAEIANSRVPGGPSGSGVDLYTLTLSGEFSATVDGAIQVLAQVSVNGGGFFNLHPININTIQITRQKETHTMTWCRELSASSSTTFRVLWRKLGGGTAALDGYLVRVERSD